MSDRYCRICWNTRAWRAPSASASDSEKGSYVARHGFGHEEWLFNYEWCIDDFRYGFLQPINHNRASLDLGRGIASTNGIPHES